MCMFVCFVSCCFSFSMICLVCVFFILCFFLCVGGVGVKVCVVGFVVFVCDIVVWYVACFFFCLWCWV